MPSRYVPTRRIVPVVLLAAVLLLAGCSASLPGGTGAGGDGAPQSGGEAAQGGGSHYVGQERVVVREADMRIEVQSFDPAFVRTREIAREHGGFVADWNHEIERGWHSGTLVVRVPAENFSDVRDDLTELGELENENVRAKDFTDTYEDLGERLSDLRRDEAALERLLNRTNSTEEARRVRADLSEVREQIRELERRRTDIEQREALSTVRLSLHEPPGKRPPKNYQSAFGFGDAFLDALYGGLTVVKYVIVLFGYAVPVGIAGLLLGGFGFVTYRVWLLLRANLDRVLPAASETAEEEEEEEEAD